MELKQFVIHRNYKKATAANQIVIGEDYSLPEGKPDISKILQKMSQLQVEEVHAEKGKIRVKGNFLLQVLYLADRSEAAAACLEMQFPFEEVLYMEDAANGDQLRIRWDTEELKVTVIHPGKLGIRAVVTLSGDMIAGEERMITEEVTGEKELFSKHTSSVAAETVVNCKESFRVREEVTLPANKANVHTLLWKELQLRNTELRLQEGRVAVKGELLFFVLYEGEEEAEVSPLQWLEQTIPFQGTLEVAGVTAETFGSLEAEVAAKNIELKPDYDGELRMFQLEMVMDLSMQLYEERSCRILTDAYSTKEQLVLKKEPVPLEKLKMNRAVKCRVRGKETVKENYRIGQLLGHHAQLQGIHTKAVENGILWEAMLEIQVLYVPEEYGVVAASLTLLLPCSQLVEVPEMDPEDRWSIHGRVEQIDLSVPEAGQMEAQAVVGLEVCVLQVQQAENITAIEETPYDPEEFKNRPSMLIHFVQQGEQLWDLAKDHRVTMEELKLLNDLSSEEVSKGQKLLILKRNPEECIG